MTHFRSLTSCFAAAAIAGCSAFAFSGVALADGSTGGYGSSGGYASVGGYGSAGGGYASAGSHGGSFLGHLRAKMHAHRAGGSIGGGSVGGGSVGGSSGGQVAVNYGSSGGSAGGRVGPLQRLVARLHAHRASAGSGGGSLGGSSGGSSGYVAASYGSSGGSTGGSSGGVSISPVSYGSSGGMVSGGSTGGGYIGNAVHSQPIYSAGLGSRAGYESSSIGSDYETYSPVVESIVSSEPVTDEAVRHESTKPAIDSDAALLTVAVPHEDAKVTVNGHETSSDGALRQFMSRGLKAGLVYTYVVKVEYEANGEPRIEEKSVKLRSGDSQRIVFENSAEETSNAEVSVTKNADLATVVKLNVPADAKVTLAGNETTGQGMVRTFRTTQLEPGQQWVGYTVQVTAMVNGQSISQERIVDVVAGSTTELTFDFDSSSIAQK